MKIGIVIGIVAIIIAAVVALRPASTSQVSEATATPTSTPASEEPKEPFTATFEIYTNGTKRIFSDSRYHNLSKDVYLTAEDPSIVHVESPGKTWNDFFATLPMQLTKDCIITGTQQTFCSNAERRLRFHINDVEDHNALDKKIVEGDHLRVEYGI